MACSQKGRAIMRFSTDSVDMTQGVNFYCIATAVYHKHQIVKYILNWQ